MGLTQELLAAYNGASQQRFTCLPPFVNPVQIVNPCPVPYDLALVPWLGWGTCTD
jgi:hypothetical protein